MATDFRERHEAERTENRANSVVSAVDEREYRFALTSMCFDLNRLKNSFLGG